MGDATGDYSRCYLRIFKGYARSLGSYGSRRFMFMGAEGGDRASLKENKKSEGFAGRRF